ncbi:hypothetical protein WJX72_002346 [[Myrmecia] bisecta]|uniref:Uncharacterized protein n=1 Tax=[Myrmecia] bisecta TaxID=41462 RepID=A0AAW1Q0F1_9CHLO
MRSSAGRDGLAAGPLHLPPVPARQVHRHLPAVTELAWGPMRAMTGSPLDPSIFHEYLRDKYSAIYQL